MNRGAFDIVRESAALGISKTYVSQAEEAAKAFENKVEHLVQQVTKCRGNASNLKIAVQWHLGI